MLAADEHRRAHGEDHLVRHLLRALVVGVAQVLEDDRELVAPQPRHGVGRAHARGQPRGHALQELVAHVVARASR